jgi:glycosyltransferase involved in cell wall biosynthesis
MRRFYGMSYSFTGHANDLFCPDEATPVGLGDLVRDAAVVVTVSDFTRDWLRERYPESAGRIERVYNGMAMSTEPPGWPREGVPVIVSVGRLIEKKGFGALVRAAGLLRDRGVAFRCVIAGEGPLRGELERQIAESGLGCCPVWGNFCRCCCGWRGWRLQRGGWRRWPCI